MRLWGPPPPLHWLEKITHSSLVFSTLEPDLQITVVASTESIRQLCLPKKMIDFLHKIAIATSSSQISSASDAEK